MASLGAGCVNLGAFALFGLKLRFGGWAREVGVLISGEVYASISLRFTKFQLPLSLCFGSQNIGKRTEAQREKMWFS